VRQRPCNSSPPRAGVSSQRCDRRCRPANIRVCYSFSVYSHHPSWRSRALANPSSSTSALPRTVYKPPGNPPRRPHFRCYPGPSLASSSCFVTAAVVSQSSYEEVLGNRLLLLLVKLRRDRAWHTNNRAACRMAQALQESIMGHRGQSTRCRVRPIHRHTAGMDLGMGVYGSRRPCANSIYPHRRHALPPNRMAQPRARPKRMGY
jgi:hypothetical protein